MPYIIMKRNDIPEGTLQVLDMDPNTSQRNLTLDVPGQTKYVNAAQNDTVVLYQPGGGGTPISLFREARGLGGWLGTNVNDGTGLPASGVMTPALTPLTGLGAPYFTIGGVLFVAMPGPSPPGTPGVFDGTLPLGPGPGTMSWDIATQINDAVNGLTALVTAIPDVPAPGDVTVTANAVGTAGNAIDFTDVSGFPGEILMVPGGGFLAGGADADSLTAAEINTSSAAILALYAFGDLTAGAGVLNLGAINGAMAAGAITAAQLTEVLDILAGRQYFVPADTQIDSNGTTYDVQPPLGTTGGPWFVPESNRDLFLNDGLPLSFTIGELASFTNNGFVYNGVPGNPNGEAVVVYNDDGTFYTP